jgi:hypothetical protein
MATSKQNLIIGFLLTLWELLVLIVFSIASLILFILMGIFILGLSIRNYFIRMMFNIKRNG